MPTPTEGENRDDFIGRCMSDDEAMEDFPDQDQRLAFCFSEWEAFQDRSDKMPKRKLTSIINFKENENLKNVMIRKQLISQVEKGEQDRTLKFTISTNAVDRDGDTINANGWKLDNFKKNPVVLWAHNSTQPPVAKSLTTFVEDGNLKSIAEFTPKDMNPFGFMVFQMFKQGFMNATSVGFEPIKFKKNEEREGFHPIDFEEQELLEFSTVPVPSNPQALIEARSKGIDMNPMLEWAEQTLDDFHGQKGIWLPKKKLEDIYTILKPDKTYSIPKSQHDEEDDKEGKNMESENKQITKNLHGRLREIITLATEALAILPPEDEEEKEKSREDSEKGQSGDFILELTDDEEDETDIEADMLKETVESTLKDMFRELKTQMTGKLD